MHIKQGCAESWSWASKWPDELEFAPSDGGHPGLSRLDPVDVRPPGRQQRLPGTGAALLIPVPLAHFTFKGVEDFVLIMMDAQGRAPCLARCSRTEMPPAPSGAETQMVTRVLRNQTLR